MVLSSYEDPKKELVASLDQQGSSHDFYQLFCHKRNVGDNSPVPGWGQHPIWPPEATGIFHEPLMSSWVAAASGLLCVFVPGVLLGRLTACLDSGPREAGTPELPLDLVPQF